MNQKAELRLKIKKLFKKYEYDCLINKEKYEKIILDTITKSNYYKNAKSIFYFYPMQEEIPLIPLLKNSLKKFKKVALPRIEKIVVNNSVVRTMNFYVLKNEIKIENQLKTGTLGIYEPNTHCIPFNIHDKKNYPLLIIVPALAYTKKGERLGRGAGYYDNYLSKLLEYVPRENIVLMGLVYDFQIVKTIPLEPHDIPVDVIVTEKATYDFLN